MIQIMRSCKYIFNICKNDIIINILILSKLDSALVHLMRKVYDSIFA